jgi:hypothetical protein
VCADRIISAGGNTVKGVVYKKTKNNKNLLF